VLGSNPFDLIERALFRFSRRRRFGFVAAFDRVGAPVREVIQGVLLGLPNFAGMHVSRRHVPGRREHVHGEERKHQENRNERREKHAPHDQQYSRLEQDRR